MSTPSGSRRIHPRILPTIEILEARIAPASTMFTFADVDGDKVTVKATNTAATISDVSTHATIVAGQLQLLDLTDASYQGADVTVTVKKSGGDGLVNVGRINATGRDLGKVSIAGDLGDFDAGDSDAHSPAVTSLTVDSLGKVGLTSQAAGTPDETFTVLGSIGPITVAKDVQNVNVQVTNGSIASLTINGSLLGGTMDNSGVFQVGGNIGPVVIGKDVIGGSGSFSAVVQADNGDIESISIGGKLQGGGDATHDKTGYFFANHAIPGGVSIKGDMIGGNGSDSAEIKAAHGNIGDVSIGGSLRGAGASGLTNNAYIYADHSLGNLKIGKDLVGGAADNSGYVYTQRGDMGDVTIKGAVTGGAGDSSAYVFADFNMGNVSIGGDVTGNGPNSATIQADSGVMGDVTIGGSLKGGDMDGSGAILSDTGMGAVKIAKDFWGGMGHQSGNITNNSGGLLESVTIGGDFKGGVGSSSGYIYNSEGAIGDVTIGGSLIGGDGRTSAYISGYGVGDVKIGKDFKGGTGAGTGAGQIYSEYGLGSITIGGDFVGGAADSNGYINASNGSIGAVSIKGSMTGGSGESSGKIEAQTGIASVKIGKNLTGGSARNAGYITTNSGDIGSVSIGGDLIGGSAGRRAGAIDVSSGKIGSVDIKGSVVGGAGEYSASIYANGFGKLTIGKDLKGGGGSNSGYVEPAYGRSGPITVGGSIIGGGGSYSGAVNASNSSLDSLTVKGDLQGGGGANSGYVYSKLDLKNLSIGGSITGGSVADSGAVYSAADIVKMSVKGGVSSGAGAFSGSIQSGKNLVSLTIGGDVVGTAGTNVEILGQQSIASLTVGGKLSFAQVLAGYTAATDNTTLTEFSADGTIGTVKIGKDFEASSIVAGASAGIDGLFGNGDDKLIGMPTSTISRIASVIIGGKVLGTAIGTDHFGIIAANIDSVKIGGVLQALTPPLDAPIELLAATTNDVTIREL